MQSAPSNGRCGRAWNGHRVLSLFAAAVVLVTTTNVAFAEPSAKPVDVRCADDPSHPSCKHFEPPTTTTAARATTTTTVVAEEPPTLIPPLVIEAPESEPAPETDVSEPVLVDAPTPAGPGAPAGTSAPSTPGAEPAADAGETTDEAAADEVADANDPADEAEVLGVVVAPDDQVAVTPAAIPTPLDPRDGLAPWGFAVLVIVLLVGAGLLFGAAKLAFARVPVGPTGDPEA